MRYYLGYLCNGWCGHGCEHHAPYGFVPECGCPIHDPDHWWLLAIRVIILKLRPLPSNL